MPPNLKIAGPRKRVDVENYPFVHEPFSHPNSLCWWFCSRCQGLDQGLICVEVCTIQLSYPPPALHLFSIVVKYTEQKMYHPKQFQLYTSVALTAFTLIGNQFPELFDLVKQVLYPENSSFPQPPPLEPLEDMALLHLESFCCPGYFIQYFL